MTILHPKAEGQWLVPGMCQGDRWKNKKSISYTSVKSIWLNKYQEIRKSDNNFDVVIEKSPPNMMRIIKLSSCFKSFSFIANNRNPYANCASILYRNYDADTLEADKRIDILSMIARDWIKRSLVIKGLVTEHKIPLITYESFCNDPAALTKELNLPESVVDTIDINSTVKVKGYEPQKISNQNDRQISKLTTEETRHLTNIFIENEELLHYFGYAIAAPQ